MLPHRHVPVEQSEEPRVPLEQLRRIRGFLFGVYGVMGLLGESGSVSMVQDCIFSKGEGIKVVHIEAADFQE